MVRSRGWATLVRGYRMTRFYVTGYRLLSPLRPRRETIDYRMERGDTIGYMSLDRTLSEETRLSTWSDVG